MLTVTILGNNSAIPAYNRYPTSHLLQSREAAYLIDCGEGTQMQMARYRIRRQKINHIFISHLHGDHYFGLPGLLTSMSLLGRTQDLHLYGPPELEHIIQLQLKAAESQLTYPLHFHPLQEEGEIMNDQQISIQCFAVMHRIPCWGFIFREKKNPRKIIPEKAAAFEIPPSFYERLQRGEDYTNAKGTIVPNEEVTAAATPAKSYAYCADTIYHESLAEKVKGVDLLYHETTYLAEEEVKAAARFHSTTFQAAEIARKADVKKLIIGHFSARYEQLDAFLEEACSIFPATELALEGVCFRC